MNRIRILIALTALAGPGAVRATPSREVAYTISPELSSGALTALDVTMKLEADGSGKTRLQLPDSDAGDSGLWRYLDDLEVDGATSVRDDGPAERTIVSRPRAPLVVRYRVRSAFDHDPGADELDTYKPTIRPRWFWVYGEALFIRPAGYSRASFVWSGAPADYPFASSLEQADGPVTIDKLVESVSVGGPEMVVQRRAVDGVPVRVAEIGRYDFDRSAFADLAIRIIAGERRFWGTREGTFLIALAPLTPTPGHKSSRGEGRAGAFAIMTTSDVSLEFLKALLAHEYFHTWNPVRLGGIVSGAREPVDYWFSEGITDYYARRLLLRMGVFSLEEFAGAWNDMLRAYASSPVRTAPVDRIVKDFWTDQNVHQLAYQRGAILAALAEARLRAASGGRVSLDEVMRAMLARAARPRSPSAPDLFLQTMRRFGVDMAPDVAAIAGSGQPALLPPNAFGDCLSVSTVTLPIYERGFDLAATRKTGVIAGVNRDSAAYAAGLRDGMGFVKIDGGAFGDSRVMLGVPIKDNDGERVISYKPEGKGTIAPQEIAVPENLTPERRAACVREASGR